MLNPKRNCSEKLWNFVVYCLFIKTTQSCSATLFILILRNPEQKICHFSFLYYWLCVLNCSANWDKNDLMVRTPNYLKTRLLYLGNCKKWEHFYLLLLRLFEYKWMTKMDELTKAVHICLLFFNVNVQSINASSTN